MTCGIYSLHFGPLFYIGKAVDIERRLEEHKTNLLRNRASERLQGAYKRHGWPTVEILFTCHEDHLSAVEAYYIAVFKPVLNTNIPRQTLFKISEDLQLSTGELLDKLQSQKEEVGELKEILNKSSTTREAELSDIINELTDSIRKKNILIDSLFRNINRPWWQRLLKPRALD